MGHGRLLIILPHRVVAVRMHQSGVPIYFEQTGNTVLLPGLFHISLPLNLQTTDGALSFTYRLKFRQTGALSFTNRLVKPLEIHPLVPCNALT